MPKRKTLPDQVRRALKERGVQVPQLAEMVSHFITIAGGSMEMAKLMYEEFLSAKKGSIIRQRILDSVLRMLAIANQSLPRVEEIDLLSDEDLEREVKELLDKASHGEEKPEQDPLGQD